MVSVVPCQGGGFSQCASLNSFTHCDQETFLYCVFGKHFIHPLLSICFKEAAPVSERAEGEWGRSALGTGPGERVQGVLMPPQTACSVRKVPGLGRRRGSVWPSSRGGVAAGGRGAGEMGLDLVGSAGSWDCALLGSEASLTLRTLFLGGGTAAPRAGLTWDKRGALLLCGGASRSCSEG